MAASYTGQCFYPVPIDYFVQKARGVAQAGLKLRYALETPIQNGLFIRMSKGTTLASWGENVQITLICAPNGTQVNIYSECAMPTQIIDMGANKKNVEGLFKYFEQGMPGR